MCVIAFVPAEIEANRKSFENCFDYNPDGAGYMYQDKKNKQVIIKKGFMKFADFWAEFKNLPTDVDRVAHFRIATSGKIDEGCCHPFPLSNDYKEMRKAKSKNKIGIAHNGIISWTEPKDKMKANYSDTMAFIANYLVKCKDMLFVPEFGDIIQHATNGKFAIMDVNDVHIIGNWEMHEGVFYSNSSYEDFRYKYTYAKGKGSKTPAWFYDYMDEQDWKKATTTGTTNVTYLNEPEYTGGYSIVFEVEQNDDDSTQDVWDTADYLCNRLEEIEVFVEDYSVAGGQGGNTPAYITFQVDVLPPKLLVGGYDWYEVEGFKP